MIVISVDTLRARRDLGGVYFQRKLYDRACACLEQVLAAAAPGDYVAEYELGLADEHLGRLPAAWRPNPPNAAGIWRACGAS